MMIKNYLWGSLLFGLAAILSKIESVNAAAWKMPSDLNCPDPTITREGNRWFVFCTGLGIQVLTSTNGHDWKRLKPVFPKGQEWWNQLVPQHNDTNVWAPDISYFNGKAHLFYSISTSGSRTSAIGYATADSVTAGNWKDQGVVTSTTEQENQYNAIDPNLVLDKKGKPWLLFGSFFDGIKITALNRKTMKPVGPLHSVARKEGGIEGTILTYHGDYWYLFVSLGHCCQGLQSNYRIAVARSKKIAGPYFDRDGVNALNGGASVIYDGNHDGILAPGGQDVFNNKVIAYHYYNKESGDRTLRINDIYWGDDGWPRF
ncbi:beta-xylosidase [Zychaea mexicana]|uniref:beta-xylosidase n=1 Tax=Zychaea mexicana TaxID=64656 RepID=UPI0022FF2DF8|nr:beta-xylosidase [Zychaea mexicana]KAI9495215.1 beta-xylosidase [Zychaea mexicana]